jgi:hypothetical protein
MTVKGQLLPDPRDIQDAESESRSRPDGVNFTRDHDRIRHWAEKRNAEPATGEATRSGPATVKVNDGGAGIRFNFPGVSAFRPITWDEWFTNFDRHGCAFVYDSETTEPLSNRYRIVKADDWRDIMHGH